jgi:ABC-2 type transport system ATP-binding protein
MESVEELCDNITLINKSKTILEGSVDEIRSQWASSEYEVVYDSDVTLEGNHQYSVLDKKTDNGKSILRIKSTGSITTNEIIGNVMKAGNLVSFNPALPSMNEIFIRVVEAKN